MLVHVRLSSCPALGAISTPTFLYFLFSTSQPLYLHLALSSASLERCHSFSGAWELRSFSIYIIQLSKWLTFPSLDYQWLTPQWISFLFEAPPQQHVWGKVVSTLPGRTGPIHRGFQALAECFPSRSGSKPKSRSSFLITDLLTTILGLGIIRPSQRGIWLIVCITNEGIRGKGH